MAFTDEDALKDYLDGVIDTMNYNLNQYREGDPWPWPGTYENARGRLDAYLSIRSMLGP